jgi:hypothetical protein
LTRGRRHLEGVRKQLEGCWTLLSLTRHDAGGRSAPVDADGQLVSDPFGNMELEYRLSETRLKALTPSSLTARSSSDALRQP